MAECGRLPSDCRRLLLDCRLVVGLWLLSRWKQVDVYKVSRGCPITQAPCRRVLKGGEIDYGVFLNEFSPHIYIRSSPYRPNRDPNRTLSNKLLLYNFNRSYKVYIKV